MVQKVKDCMQIFTDCMQIIVFLREGRAWFSRNKEKNIKVYFVAQDQNK